MVTPLSPVHVVLGKIIPYVVIGLFELSAVLAAATLWFVCRSKAISLQYSVRLIYMTSSIVSASLCRRSRETRAGFVHAVVHPHFFLFLSGFFLALENMPSWVQNSRTSTPSITSFHPAGDVPQGQRVCRVVAAGLAMLAIGRCGLRGVVIDVSEKSKLRTRYSGGARVRVSPWPCM